MHFRAVPTGLFLSLLCEPVADVACGYPSAGRYLREVADVPRDTDALLHNFLRSN